jgi:hypothetical protein
MSDSERELAIKELDSSKQSLSPGDYRHRFIDSLMRNAKSIRCAYLGKFGEIMVMPKGAKPLDGALSIERDDVGSGLKIYDTRYTARKELFSVAQTGGIVTSTENEQDGFRFNGDLRWPTLEGKELLIPESQLFITRDASKSRKRKVKKPNGATAWYFLDRDNRLHAPSDPDAEPVENCVWLSKGSNGSLLLTHSGPNATGVFAEIAENLEMTYKEGGDTNNNCLWPFADKHRKPAAFIYPAILQNKCYEKIEYLVIDGYLLPQEAPYYAH